MSPLLCSNLSIQSHLIIDHPLILLLEKKCKTMKDLKQIHAQFIKTGLSNNTLAVSRLLSFSAVTKFGGSGSVGGDINYAYLIFRRIENKNLFTWNTIIRGFSNSSTPQNAIFLFIEMLNFSSTEPQNLTYPSVFKAFAQMGLAQNGAQLHGRVKKLGLDFDPFIRNTMIYMYCNCGVLLEARKLFDFNTVDVEDNDLFDVVSWNSMIMGFSKNGEIDEALELFDRMPKRNNVTWSSMISGCVRNGRFIEAFDLFGDMQCEGFSVDEYTIVSLLNASACLGALEKGEWIHRFYEKNKSCKEMNVIVATAIIDMYCKCGCVNKAVKVFNTTPNKGLSCWNSMILGLAMRGGYESEAIQLFSTLETSNHFEPDDVSFIGVLTACNHSGLVNKAKELFSLMTQKYGIKPSIKHYGLMGDVLGRSGQLKVAKELIAKMEIDPDVILWSSLLAACRKHGNVEMAEEAAKRIIELDSSENSSYILMSNLYSAYNRFDEALDQRVSMKKRRIKKEPGCSSIEIRGEVHEFVAGSQLHPRLHEIYWLLNGIDNACA